MKKAILKTSGTLLVVGLALTAMLFGCRHKAEPKTGAEQQTESVNPAIFTTNGNGKITGYTCSSEELPKNLVIPAKIGDEVITSIGYCAFFGCSGLTSVSLSSCTSLTSIGGGAFSGCSGLTSVSFPASLTSIGSEAFYCCTGLTSMSFPASLTSIGSGAFSGCRGLTSVSLPASLTSIGDSAFSGCSSLTSVSFPASLTWIGDSAFSGCSRLTSVNFPASLTSIGKEAFLICYNLTSATFADTVGWAVYNNGHKVKATDIQQSDLQNPATAAEYLRNTYLGKHWKKN